MSLPNNKTNSNKSKSQMINSFDKQNNKKNIPFNKLLE